MVRSFHHIFKAQSAEAQRCTLELPGGCSRSPAIRLPSLGQLCAKRWRGRRQRLGGSHHITLAPVVVSQDTTDQLDCTDACHDPSVLPSNDGQVSCCYLSTFLVLSPEYSIIVQVGSA